MHIKTLLAALAGTAVAAAGWDYGDYLATAYPIPVAISSTAQDGHTTYYVDCAPAATSMGCLVGDGATVVKGQGVVDMKTVMGDRTISQHCTYSGTAPSPTCTISSVGPSTTSAFTTTINPKLMGVGPAATGTQSGETASTKGSPVANTATATSTTSSASVTGENTGSAQQSATQTTENGAVSQATGMAWAAGAAMVALAVV